MSYQPISVREAMADINAVNGTGWFLPYVQRDYVWGSRFQAEERILSLLDSLFKGYPIGSLILWKTSDDVPFHKFLDDLDSDETRSMTVDSGSNTMVRYLVYDGQQRLQTLHSVLKHSFNQKIAVFDLLHRADDEDIGFAFLQKNDPCPAGHVKLNEIFLTSQPKTKFKQGVKAAFGRQLDNEEEVIFETNFDQLWQAFREEGQKSLVKWVVSESDEKKVNEIFMRLNTGGIPLTKPELMLAKLSERDKAIHDTLGEICSVVERNTNGYNIDQSEILRVLFQLVKGNLRVDVEKTTKQEMTELTKIVSGGILRVYTEFFRQFLLDEFQINNSALVPQKYALYPLVVFSYKLREKRNRAYVQLDDEVKQKLKQYFLLSQLKAWNLQGLIDQASRLIIETADKPNWSGDFPLDDILNLVKASGKREFELRAVDFENNDWFALKVLRNRINFNFVTKASGRSNPELEHIFPRGLKKDDDYRERVNVVWNLDAISGNINNIKKNKHPREYFLENPGVMAHYQFLPDLNLPVWKDEAQFISWRKAEMLAAFTRLYGLPVRV